MPDPKSAFTNQRVRFHQWSRPYANKPTFDPDKPGKGTRPRGGMPSRKNGRTVGFWDPREYAAVVLFEASPDVVAYEERPERLHFRDDDRWLAYVPHFSVRTVRGHAVVELSARGEPRSPREQTVAEFARAYYSGRGIRYVELSHGQLLAKPLAQRAHSVLRYLSVKPSGTDIVRATDALSAGPVPLHRVEELSGVSQGRLIAMAHMGVLRIHGSGQIQQTTLASLPGQEMPQ